MTDDPTLERIIARILAGTPARAVDAGVAGQPGLLAEVDETREVMGLLGLGLDPVAPSAGLRARLLDAVDAVPVVPRKSALLVVDMLVDHLTPGCALEVPRARDIVPAMSARLDQARASGEPVLYLCDHHEPGDPDLLNWPHHNTGDPAESVWPAIAPRSGDLVITHRHYSVFSDTALDQTLRGLGVNALEITGCITEIHLYATAIDALQRGYKVTVPSALQAGSNELVEQVILGALGVLRPVEPDIAR